MSEARTLPLVGLVTKGRFGALTETPGVALTVMHPATLVAVIARRGKAKVVAAALKALPGASVLWAGPDQHFVEGVDCSSLKKMLGANASIVDQSHGRVVIRLVGSKARAVLAKGTPVDLHPDHFPLGKSAMTQMAHIGVHITRSGTDAFTLSVFRGFSESFWQWLVHSAREYGYEVV